MTAIILAGGKSSRFGLDKAFIKVRGLPLIISQIKLLKEIFKKIIIITNNPKRYKFKGVKIFQDIVPGKGPLGGIYTALTNSDTFYNFVIACDMPNLSPKLIKHILKQRNGFDVVVPHLKNGYETLFAIYSKNCIMPIYAILNSRDLRIRNLFKKVRVREIDEDEIKEFGDPDVLFTNINTQKEYAKLLPA